MIEGAIAADTAQEAREQIRAQGMAVQEIGLLQTQASASVVRRWSAKRCQRKLALAIRDLATLLGVGIPLLDALQTVIIQQRGTLRDSLILLRDRVAAGVSLAEAMAEQPDLFDPLCIHMAEVGENSGALEQVLDEWAEFKDRSSLLKDRVFTALMYPCFVSLLGIGVTVFLMTYVMPMLLESLLEAGRPLPWPTRVAKSMSDLLINNGWLLAAAIALLVGVGMAILQTPWGQRARQTVLMRIPLLGPMARKQAIARMSLVVATLMKSGVEFLRALEVTAHSGNGNVLLREALDSCGRDVGAGSEIGKALERTGFFPPTVVQIFAVGQESGRLEEMLERLAGDYDRQVSRMCDRLTALLEPVMILVLAAFVGFILFAIVLPILEAGNVM